MAKRSSVEDFIVDFTKEESSGGRIKVKAGTYKFRIVNAKIKTSEGGRSGLELKCAFKEGTLAKRKKSIVETLWNSPKAYSRYRCLMEALEMKVPKGKLDLRKLAAAVKGKEFYGEVQTEKSEGYADKSVIAFEGFINPDDYDPDEDADEDDEDVDEDVDEDDNDDEDDEDEDDDEDDDEDEDDDDEDDEEDDDDDDEEPAPKKKRKAPAKKAPVKKAKKKKSKDDDLDLEDF